MDEAEENNLSDKALEERWRRWDTCSLCEQWYHGVVACALGWACWKTYLRRPETDQARDLAMDLLGKGLDEANKVSEALKVSRVHLATIERVRPNDMQALLNCKQNLAYACGKNGQVEEALSTRREVHSIAKAALGPLHVFTINSALNLACSLREVSLAECMSLVRETMPIANRVFGADHEIPLRFVWTYGDCIIESDETKLSQDDMLEAIVTLEEGFRRSRRVMGPQHPITRNLDGRLARVREKKQIAQH